LDEWTQDNVNLCVQRQKRILHDSYSCLAQEGILIYMTCSFSQEENEEMVDYILDNFDVENCGLPLDEKWHIVETESENNKGKGYRFFPHKLKGEGFFLACFKKKDGSLKDIPYEKNKNKLIIESEVLTKYVDMKGLVAINQNNNILLMQETHIPYYTALTPQLKLIKKGILAGQIIRNELIPDHELAMCTKIKKEINSTELTINEAILYLKKENITLNNSPKGWLLVQFQQRNLGWVKNIGNRVNNYYPSNYRILSKNILPS
jgi:NOL1/NOP2/fmu family ribosome biogenesis protein